MNTEKTKQTWITKKKQNKQNKHECRKNKQTWIDDYEEGEEEEGDEEEEEESTTPISIQKQTKPAYEP